MSRSSTSLSSLSPSSHADLPESTRTVVAKSRGHMARLLATLAEIDARRLYRRAGHPTLYAYVRTELAHDDREACERVLAARAARRFPVLFEAIADGRLNPSAVNLLEPHLTEETVEALVAAATNKTEAEIDQLLSKRLRRPKRRAVARQISLPFPCSLRS
jgi:hypothetical protein